MSDDFGYDEIFDDTNDLFFIDEGEKSVSNVNDSKDSSGDYLTEQAFHNDLESQISITERSSRFLQLIYVELLRVIKPMEMVGSYKRVPRQRDENTDIEFMTSPRASTLEDELDEDYLIENA